ncbi:30S ribosomal protein S4e [Candidatus Woesearchaeota archaeon]|nr:30S ribosomal protein S4e [Candidatus Woesearchaeota archaeon]
MSRHLKRYNAPKSWAIKRKERKYIMRLSPGPHNKKMSVPLNIVLRDMLSLSDTKKETKRILYANEVLIDGVRRKDEKFPVGLFDVVDLKGSGKAYRVTLDGNGMIKLVEAKDPKVKPLKIISKSLAKGGRVQLGFHDGKTILTDGRKYRVGDSVLAELPEMSIKKSLELEKGASIFLIGGKNIGVVGKVKDIAGRRIMYESNGQTYQTLRSYAFVIGGDKPSIALE